MAKRNTSDTILAKRGMVFYMELGDDSNNKGGTMIKKCRPCVVISVDEGWNDTNPPRYQVAPIVSRDGEIIFDITDVLFMYNNAWKASVCNTPTPVSSYDVKNYVYTLNDDIMKKIDNAIKVHYGFAPVSILDINLEDVKDFREYKTEKILLAEEEGMLAADDNSTSKATDPSKQLINIPYPIPVRIGSNVVNIDKNKGIVCKHLTRPELIVLSKKKQKDWTIEECLSFIDCFTSFTNEEIAHIFGIKKGSIYSLKYQINKRLSDENVSRINTMTM